MKPHIHCFQVIMCLTIKCSKHIGNTRIEILHVGVASHGILDDVTVLEIVR
jgi:hypothetical protein